MKLENLIANTILLFVMTGVVIFTMYVTTDKNSDIPIEVDYNHVSEVRYIEQYALSLDTLNREQKCDSIYNLILDYGFRFPDIVFAQAVLESGWFESNITRRNNNIFGMKVPKKRETLGIPTPYNDYNFYYTIEDCVMDRMIYENLYLENIEKEEYYSKLASFYASDKNYINKLKSIKR